MIFLLIDGDGHHRFNEEEIVAKVWDLILSNDEINIKRSTHKMPGDLPLTVLEVLPPNEEED